MIRPTGTVTFLMTDIEGSTARWERDPEAMRLALAAHDAVLRHAIANAGGWLFKHTGDGVLAAFDTPKAALDAAITAQRQLELPVRMGIGTGQAELRDEDYFGPALNRTARTMAAGHGGQVLLGEASAAQVDGIELLDLGEHRLRGLSQRQRLFQACADGLRASFPALNSLDEAAGNLPARASGLFGRDRDLAAIISLMGEARLVTLSGVGGVGKTRLALEAASRVAGEYPGGAWLAELAFVGNAEAVGHTVASTLGVTQQAGKSVERGIVEALGARKLLLVLDNCEHVLAPVADLARAILARCANVTVITTTREALAIEGERLWTVAPLGEPPAVELFVERARAVAPGFDPAREAASVAEICRRLDGIPLAIELAAARVRSMSPGQIRDRLDERFRLLTGGTRRTLERHQTLRGAVQWSFDLLSDKERAFLARASVFAAGFGLDAAEAVCSGGAVESQDVIDLLDSLVRKSLVTVEFSTDAARYGLLETIRQYGEERAVASGEMEIARQRHAAWFARESDRRFAQWLSPDQSKAYQWLDLEMANLRAAFHWARESGAVDPAARIASNVGDMARFMIRDEAANWASEIVDAARSIRHRRLIVLLTWAASSAWAFGDRQRAKRFAEEAIGLIDDPGFDPFVWAYTDLAMVAVHDGDASGAVELVRRAASHPSDRRDRFCAALLPLMLAAAGRMDEAMEHADEAVAIASAAGVPSSIAAALYGKGQAFAGSDPAGALVALEEALSIARRTGNSFWGGMAAVSIAAQQASRGAPDAALRSFRELIQMWRRSTDMFFLFSGMGSLIVLFERLGRNEPAVTLYGTLTTLFDKGALAPELGMAMTRARTSLGESAFAAAGRRGSALAVPEACDYALAEIEHALA